MKCPHTVLFYGGKNGNSAKLTPFTTGSSGFCISMWLRRQDAGFWDQIAYVGIVRILAQDKLAG